MDSSVRQKRFLCLSGAHFNPFKQTRANVGANTVSTIRLPSGRSWFPQGALGYRAATEDTGVVGEFLCGQQASLLRPL